MGPKPICPICGNPMWLVVVEGSPDGAASHFECFFHNNEGEPDSSDAVEAEGFEDEEPVLTLVLRADGERIPLQKEGPSRPIAIQPQENLHRKLMF